MSELKVDELSKEDLAMIVKLMKDGMAYEEALVNLVPEQRRDLVMSFHSLFCKMNHNDMDGCNFYNESEWDAPAHKFWFNVVDRVLRAYDPECEFLPDIIPYIWRVESIKREVEKEVAVGGLQLFDYLLKASF